jgi:hypothetical protein
MDIEITWHSDLKGAEETAEETTPAAASTSTTSASVPSRSRPSTPTSPRVSADLTGRGLSRVTACAVRPLDLGLFRIGSDRHTKVSETYGLTTMLREHVTCGRGEPAFCFPAKGGTELVRALVDEQAHAVVRALPLPAAAGSGNWSSGNGAPGTTCAAAT